MSKVNNKCLILYIYIYIYIYIYTYIYISKKIKKDVTNFCGTQCFMCSTIFRHNVV